jgi:hypothetical protein
MHTSIFGHLDRDIMLQFDPMYQLSIVEEHKTTLAMLSDTLQQVNSLQLLLDRLYLLDDHVKKFGLTKETLHLINADNGFSKLFNISSLYKEDESSFLEGTEDDSSFLESTSVEEILAESDSIKDKLKQSVGKLLNKVGVFFNRLPSLKKALAAHEDTYTSLEIDDEEFQFKAVKAPTKDALDKAIGLANLTTKFVIDICQYNGIEEGHKDALLDIYAKFSADTNGELMRQGKPNTLKGWSVIFPKDKLKATVGKTTDLGYETAADVSSLGKATMGAVDALLHLMAEHRDLIKKTYAPVEHMELDGGLSDPEAYHNYMSVLANSANGMAVANAILAATVVNYIGLITTVTK